MSPPFQLGRHELARRRRLQGLDLNQRDLGRLWPRSDIDGQPSKSILVFDHDNYIQSGSRWDVATDLPLFIIYPYLT